MLGRDEGHRAAIRERDRQVVAGDRVARRLAQARHELLPERVLAAERQGRRARRDREPVRARRLVRAGHLVAVGRRVERRAVVERDGVFALVGRRDHALEGGHLLGDRGEVPGLAGQPAAASAATGDEHRRCSERERDEDQSFHGRPSLG